MKKKKKKRKKRWEEKLFGARNPAEKSIDSMKTTLQSMFRRAKSELIPRGSRGINSSGWRRRVSKKEERGAKRSRDSKELRRKYTGNFTRGETFHLPAGSWSITANKPRQIEREDRSVRLNVKVRIMSRLMDENLVACSSSSLLSIRGY